MLLEVIEEMINLGMLMGRVCMFGVIRDVVLELLVESILVMLF